MLETVQTPQHMAALKTIVLGSLETSRSFLSSSLESLVSIILAKPLKDNFRRAYDYRQEAGSVCKAQACWSSLEVSLRYQPSSLSTFSCRSDTSRFQNTPVSIR